MGFCPRYEGSGFARGEIFFGGHFENWRAPRGFYKVIPTRHGSGNETVSFKSFNVENNCSCQDLNFTGKMEDKILI